ncbi:MAG: hypothetical protein NTV08_20500 [Verrucomicrobia bacterium]|nr:hypothetical protein [Verrucomicrobiota bacterium]
MSETRPELNDDERAIYEWQMWISRLLHGRAAQTQVRIAAHLARREDCPVCGG